MGARVLSSFTRILLRREPLKLVDDGHSHGTFTFIEDAIEAILLMIDNPVRANDHIFNVGNPRNEVTIRQLAELMIQVYSYIKQEEALEVPTIVVSSETIYGKGYDDCDKGLPDITKIQGLLGWSPKTHLPDARDHIDDMLINRSYEVIAGQNE